MPKYTQAELTRAAARLRKEAESNNAGMSKSKVATERFKEPNASFSGPMSAFGSAMTAASGSDNPRPPMQASVPTREPALPTGLPSPDQYRAQQMQAGAPAPMSPPPPMQAPPPPPVIPPPNYAMLKQQADELEASQRATFAAPSPLPQYQSIRPMRMGMR